MAVLLLDEFTSLELIKTIPVEDELFRPGPLAAIASLSSDGDIDFVVVGSGWGEFTNWVEEDLEIMED